MKAEKNRMLRQFKWHIIIGGIVIIAVVLLTALVKNPAVQRILNHIWFVAGLGILFAVTVLLTKAVRLLALIGQNRQKLDKIADSIEKNRDLLEHINQSARLSEKAKSIAFHDTDRQALREAVFEKLQQMDFDGTYEIINEIATSTAYQTLAAQLTEQADKYRDATDQERINQVISHIEKLFETYQWTKASAYTERLIKAEPTSDKAKMMRKRLIEKKQERKKVLLKTWDDAVKREDTDGSLEILKELDFYLTPNEGLALQEAAKDVFKNKLHSLGVKFSLAVSEKQWINALEAGGQIIRDFPNSRMAEEIRGKWEILRQKAKQQG